MEIKDQADACVEDRRYLDAAEYLDTLENLAQYTPSQEETVAFVEEVEKKADLEADYRQAVRDAIEEAEVLRQKQVDPGEVEAVDSSIKAIEKPYQVLYGTPDIPTRPPLKDNALPLTIDQKLGLSLHLNALAKRSPNRDATEDLTDELQERRAEMQELSLDDRDGLDLVEEYPDHPEAEAALDELLNEKLPLWALPSQIRRMQSAVEEYRDYLPEEKVKARVKELKKRDAAFRWDEADSPVAITLSLFGVFFGAVVASTSGGLPGFLAGSLLVGGALLIQYFKPSSDGGVEEIDSNQNGKPTSQKSGSQIATRETSEEGYPAGTWKCPNCGRKKKKEERCKRVVCPKHTHITEMRYVEDESESKKDTYLSETTSSEVGPLPKDEALSCVHDYDNEEVCRKCGWSKEALKKIDDAQSNRSIKMANSGRDNGKSYDETYPPGVWRCPKCGDQEVKEMSYNGVLCNKCDLMMEYKKPKHSGCLF
jgi:rubredoxin